MAIASPPYSVKLSQKSKIGAVIRPDGNHIRLTWKKASVLRHGPVTGTRGRIDRRDDLKVGTWSRTGRRKSRPCSAYDLHSLLYSRLGGTTSHDTRT